MITRAKRAGRWLKWNWLLLWYGCLRPGTAKGAWISVGGWAFALTFAVLSGFIEYFTADWLGFAFVLAIGALDAVMLLRSAVGLQWRLDQNRVKEPE